MVSVNKGLWDRSLGWDSNYTFTRAWLAACQTLLKPNGTIWISGTTHIIHIVALALEELGYKILNEITWVKPNPPPNLSCRYFTHATETLIWAGKSRKCRHKFNYCIMKKINGGKQMTTVWTITPPLSREKVFGRHPTQKPLALLERIVAAASDEQDCILDPFCGSATTGIAAAKKRRNFVGLDTDAGFLNLAIMRFMGVPQADSPERLLELIRRHDCGGGDAPTLAKTMKITERQVHYYRHAAMMLGMVLRSPTGWDLTAAGRQLCEGDETTARRMLADAIREMPLVRVIRSKIRKGGSEMAVRARVTRTLRKCTILGRITCKRRAATLKSWIDWSAITSGECSP